MAYVMKIMHVTQSLVGGPAAYLDEIAEAQITAFGDNNVKFFLPDDQIQYCQRIPQNAIIRFKSTARNISSLISFACELCRAVNKEVPSVLHLHCTLAGAIGRLCLPAFVHPRPRVVYCPHGWSFGMKTAFWKRLAFASFEFGMSKTADRIIVISEHDRKQAQDWRQPASRLRLIRNAINDSPSHSEYTQSLFDTGKLNLLFVGRLDKQKGFDILLQAFAKANLDNAVLHVIGASFLDEDEHSGSLPPNVELHGWKSRDELLTYYSQADALVVPSRWEGFGLVAAEALRAGCPVLAADVGGLPELVIDGETGFLFPPGSVEALSNLLRKIDKRLLAELRPLARQLFLDCFHADRLNRELIALYRELAEPSPRDVLAAHEAKRV